MYVQISCIEIGGFLLNCFGYEIELSFDLCGSVLLQLVFEEGRGVQFWWIVLCLVYVVVGERRERT